MEYGRDRDQAGTLRALSREFEADYPPEEKRLKAARVMSVTSGKGGVGKTICVANLEIGRAHV